MRLTSRSANGLWTPRLLRQPPIDAFQQIAKLRRRDRHRAVRAIAGGRRRPDKTAAFQPLREQAHALAVVPQHFDQATAPAADLLAISSTGELAIGLNARSSGPFFVRGTLARAPMGGEEVAAGPTKPGKGENASMEEAIGVSVQPLSSDDAQDPRFRPVVQQGGGMVVTDVATDGPAFVTAIL